MEILSGSRLPLRHLGIKSKSANAKIINDNAEAIDIPTTLPVVKYFLALVEFDASDADGPSAFFPWVCPEEDCEPEDGGAPATGGAGAGVVGDVGEGNGATVVLNGFPSVLHGENQN